jgi:hypothetical protein
MNKHPLERASWIAGIVSAIVAVVVWLAPPKSASEGAEPKKTASVSQVNSAAIASSASDSTTAPKQSEMAANPELTSQVALADAIYGPDARNAAYVKIIDQTLARNDYALTRDIIGKLYGPDFRNRQYLRTIDQAITQNRLEVAEELAPKIYGPDARNAVLSRLLDARAKSVAAKAVPSLEPAAQPIIPPDLAHKAAQGR